MGAEGNLIAFLTECRVSIYVLWVAVGTCALGKRSRRSARSFFFFSLLAKKNCSFLAEYSTSLSLGTPLKAWLLLGFELLLCYPYVFTFVSRAVPFSLWWGPSKKKKMRAKKTWSDLICLKRERTPAGLCEICHEASNQNVPVRLLFVSLMKTRGKILQSTKIR